MKTLELKVPPIALVVISGGIMWLIAEFTPAISTTKSIEYWLAGGVLILGMLFCFLGVFEFRRKDTTVNPMKPEDSSSLVTSGIYTITRNPMYVGFLLLLVSWAIFLSSLFSVAVLGIFIAYMNQYQIKPEERMLQTMFGKDYEVYTKRVRRWL